MKFIDDYIQKKIKELEEHPEKNKKSSRVFLDAVSFAIILIFWLLVIFCTPHRYWPSE